MNIPMNVFDALTGMEQLRDGAMVYTDRQHDNRKFVTKYFGVRKDLVEARAKRVLDSIDSYASPHMGDTKFDGEYYSVTVTYYSVD